MSFFNAINWGQDSSDTGHQKSKCEATKDAVNSNGDALDAVDAIDDDGVCSTYQLIAILTSGHWYT